MRDRIIAYVVALVILVLAIGGVAYSAGYCFTDKDMKARTHGEDTLVVVEGEGAMPHNTVIVSDRYVGKLDKDASVVAISKDGQAYVVRNGVVLADDMVISADEESSYSVRRLDDERKSVSYE